MYFARICEVEEHEYEILLTCRKFIVLYQCKIKTVVISAADTVELGELLKELGKCMDGVNTSHKLVYGI
jgi:hypothetical protein